MKSSKLKQREQIETTHEGETFRGERVVIGTHRLDQYIIFESRCVADLHGYAPADRDGAMLGNARQHLWEITTGRCIHARDASEFGL